MEEEEAEALPIRAQEQAEQVVTAVFQEEAEEVADHPQLAPVELEEQAEQGSLQ